MGSVTDSDSPKPITIRHKCIACFKQYKKKEHLVEHMKNSHHSVHQPKCGVCKKHCRTFESLREHVTGLLAKDNCSRTFAELGCKLCLQVFESSIPLSQHKWTCRLPPPTQLGAIPMPTIELKTSSSDKTNGTTGPHIREAIAIDCEMVGGGSDGTLNLCARVCLIDEDENIVFHTYVQPQIPITDYRSKVTGLTEELLKDSTPLKDVQEKIQEILYNGESIGIARIDGGKARLLVGHSLDHDLDCLNMTYPDHLIRDTAKYHPLMKTNLVSFSLKYLTKMYLGWLPLFDAPWESIMCTKFAILSIRRKSVCVHVSNSTFLTTAPTIYDIQMGIHDPYEDCVSVMRLYKRMRDQDHLSDFVGASLPSQVTEFLPNEFDCYKIKDLENMRPEELYNMSRSNYRCWCLDSVPNMRP